MTVFMRPVDVRAYCSLCEKREMCDSLSFSIYKEKPAEKIQRASMLLSCLRRILCGFSTGSQLLRGFPLENSPVDCFFTLSCVLRGKEISRFARRAEGFAPRPHDYLKKSSKTCGESPPTIRDSSIKQMKIICRATRALYSQKLIRDVSCAGSAPTRDSPAEVLRPRRILCRFGTDPRLGSGNLPPVFFIDILFLFCYTENNRKTAQAALSPVEDLYAESIVVFGRASAPALF